jgi:hypothetical protein
MKVDNLQNRGIKRIIKIAIKNRDGDVMATVTFNMTGNYWVVPVMRKRADEPPVAGLGQHEICPAPEEGKFFVKGKIPIGAVANGGGPAQHEVEHLFEMSYCGLGQILPDLVDLRGEIRIIPRLVIFSDGFCPAIGKFHLRYSSCNKNTVEKCYSYFLVDVFKLPLILRSESNYGALKSNGVGHGLDQDTEKLTIFDPCIVSDPAPSLIAVRDVRAD